MKYEHKIIDADNLTQPVLSGQTHGERGWRVVGVFVRPNLVPSYSVVLEREKVTRS